MLVVNPKATATSERQRDVLTRALGSDLKVDVVQTTHRGHAIELGAAGGRRPALDLVVVLGGDGTINEVVNGLLGSGPWQGPAPDAPALAVVPGGSTNVFSRALGIARDPVVATSELLEALRAGRSRRIGLGRVDERWFTFTAGLGIDADAVRRVERARAQGQGLDAHPLRPCDGAGVPRDGPPAPAADPRAARRGARAPGCSSASWRTPRPGRTSGPSRSC